MLNTLTWHLKSKRQQLKAALQVNVRPFLHPYAVARPTIRDETRCTLENLRELHFTGWLPGLSDETRKLIQQALAQLVVERTYKSTFEMVNLHGCHASRTNMWSNPVRASCHSMAEMGKLVNDLTDLKGLNGEDIISACKSWSEMRLDEGIQLLTDTWHQRFYWCNSGGSHHMAVLCHELQKQRKSWCPEVEIREFSLNLQALDTLDGAASIFVVMHNPKAYNLDLVFEPLPYQQGHLEIREHLGVEVLRPGTDRGCLSRYNLVVIDHSRKFAPIGLKKMQEAIETGHATSLATFLREWMVQDLAIGHPNKQIHQQRVEISS